MKSLDYKAVERIKNMVLVHMLTYKEILNNLGWTDHRLRPHYREAVRRIKGGRGQVSSVNPSRMPHRRYHNPIPERMREKKVGFAAQVHFRSCKRGEVYHDGPVGVVAADASV